MATREPETQHQRRGYPRVKKIGTFIVHDGQRLQLSRRLNNEGVPNQPGDELDVNLITEEDGYQYLEVHPPDGGD